MENTMTHGDSNRYWFDEINRAVALDNATQDATILMAAAEVIGETLAADEMDDYLRGIRQLRARRQGQR